MSTSSPSTAPVQVDNCARILLSMALLMGLVVFVRLGEWGLWIDEAFTLSDSLNMDSADNPVGYLLFGAYYKSLIASGIRPDEWSMRILPAVLGWLGIPLTYWAFRKSAGNRVAAGAALLLAVSSWHLYWSQNARFYTLAQDLVLIGSGFGLRALLAPLGRARIGQLIAGLVFFGLGALVHPTVALVGAAFVVTPLVRAGLESRFPGGRQMLAGGLGPLLGLVALLGGVAAVVWGGPILELWVRNKGAGTPAHFVLTMGFFVTPLLGAACLFGALDAWRERSDFGATAALVVGLGVVFAVGVSFFARFTAQYIFSFLPWFCVLAAVPLGHAKGARERLLGLGLLGVIVLTGLTQQGLYLTVRNGERPHWREAYRFVFNQRQGDDQIIGMAAEVGEYYLNPRATDLRAIEDMSYLMTHALPSIRNWAREDRRAWFVLNPERMADWPKQDALDFEAMLAADCRLVKAWPLYVESRDLSVMVYLRD